LFARVQLGSSLSPAIQTSWATGRWCFFFDGFFGVVIFHPEKMGGRLGRFFLPNLWFVCIFFFEELGFHQPGLQRITLKSILIKQQLRIIPPKSKRFLEILRQTSGLKVVSFLL